MVVLDGVSLEEDDEEGSVKRDRMRKNAISGACFGLLGLDFMVDEEKKYDYE